MYYILYLPYDYQNHHNFIADCIVTTEKEDFIVKLSLFFRNENFF